MNFLRKQMKWVMAVVVIAFLLSTFLMYEGGSSRRKPTVNADGTMSDYEVAQINGRSFMRSELENRRRAYLDTFSSRNTESLDMAAVYQTVFNQAVLESQLLKEIDEQGIKVSDAEAEQAMKNYADTYYPTRETFYQALEQSGIKVEDYKRNLARQIAVDRLMNNAIGEINISEDKAVGFYDSMKDLFFTKPEGFMVHMADFKTSDDAEAFRAKLIGGESWDVIASNDTVSSDDVINITKEPLFLPSSALRMGTFTALASLDIAEPSLVLPVSSFDFAVVMKTSHVDSSVRPYDEVSADIRSLLTQEEERKRLADYNETLTAKANIVINDKELFESKAVSVDEEPEITIEEVSGDVKPEEPATSEDVKAVVEEVKAEEAKSKDAPVAVEVKEEPKEEVKSEESVKSEDVKAVVEEVKAEETKSEDTAATVEVKEEAKEEVKSEEPVKSEDVKAVVEEVKAEETKSEDTAATVEVKEEAKEEVKSEEPVKSEDVKAVVEEVKAEETKSEDATIAEEIKTISEDK